MIPGKHSTSAAQFVDELAGLRFENTFNPYADFCPIHDTVDAIEIRRRNLETVLSSAISNGVDSIWFARDLGYRGGRRTGLALTDEVHLYWHAQIFGVPSLLKATKGPVVAERTATIVWQAIRIIKRSIFLWNIFPFHPHKPNEPMSNRCHTKAEGKACQELSLWLIDVLRPKSIMAIGRDSQSALAKLGVKSASIRHPSYGGQIEFLNGLAHHYKVSINSNISQGNLF